MVMSFNILGLICLLDIPLMISHERYIHILELSSDKQFGRWAGLCLCAPRCTPDPSLLSVYPKEAIIYESHQLYLLTSGQGYPA